MIIDFNAFKNCTSLKELHFEKCSEPVNSNIYDCDIPDDCKIIIPNKLKKQWLETEIKANHFRIRTTDEFIDEKIHFSHKHSNVILSIIYIEKALKLIDDDKIKTALSTLIE